MVPCIDMLPLSKIPVFLLKVALKLNLKPSPFQMVVPSLKVNALFPLLLLAVQLPLFACELHSILELRQRTICNSRNGAGVGA